MEKKENRGGARTGAGRPSVDTEVFYRRLPSVLVDQLNKIPDHQLRDELERVARQYKPAITMSEERLLNLFQEGPLSFEFRKQSFKEYKQAIKALLQRGLIEQIDRDSKKITYGLVRTK